MAKKLLKVNNQEFRVKNHERNREEKNGRRNYREKEDIRTRKEKKVEKRLAGQNEGFDYCEERKGWRRKDKKTVGRGREGEKEKIGERFLSFRAKGKGETEKEEGRVGKKTQSRNIKKEEGRWRKNER